MVQWIVTKMRRTYASPQLFLFSGIFLFLFFSFYLFPEFLSSNISYEINSLASELKKEVKAKIPKPPPLNKALYDAKLVEMANNSTTPPYLWPAKAAYPLRGAVLPMKRVVAYYGNLYSRQMGVLGEYEEDIMLAKLMGEVEVWNEADPKTPVVPALHYIAVVAQGTAGKDGKYRFRMPGSEIDKVIKMAEKIGGMVFLDLQVGFSDAQTEIPVFEKYLKMPNVHLGLDPEFSMKTGIRPGKVVGTLDAADINFASEYLATLVRENNLPPKILVIHRFTGNMVTNYDKIETRPEAQIVMDMDGWGPPAKKVNTYRQFIRSEPVQFTGFKLFYKNDLFDPGTELMRPADLLKLNPRPVYIQYQ